MLSLFMGTHDRKIDEGPTRVVSWYDEESICLLL